jgi:copper homeostasis protein
MNPLPAQTPCASARLEIIAFNIASCQIAQAAGATRIELCDNPAEGGTTPSYGFIKAARKKLRIDLFAMIRPRGGDFLYSDDEFEIMKTDLAACRQLGCDGVVIGLLNKDGSVDRQRSKELVELARPMAVTFHRAFDRTRDPLEALEAVIETGCDRILTSGQAPTCLGGSALIARLRQHARERIIIMPGSGLTSSNLLEMARITGANEFHSSARICAASTMDFVVKAMDEDLQQAMVDGDEVGRMAQLLGTAPPGSRPLRKACAPGSSADRE